MLEIDPEPLYGSGWLEDAGGLKSTTSTADWSLKRMLLLRGRSRPVESVVRGKESPCACFRPGVRIINVVVYRADSR